ncbi:hypothetical protein FM036_45630 [Nostoc sp. HG1]|nr:hypothetical protein [Nostoc sp. HG1]
MPYCKIGDKPTLSYQFRGQSEKIVKFHFSPVDVIVKSVQTNSTDNYSAEGFQVSAYSTNDFFVKSYIVTDYYIEDGKISQDSYDYRYNFLLYGKQCGFVEYVGLAYVSPSSIVIDRNIKCPIPEESETCIKVSYKNRIIFKDQSMASVTFSVSCGDCPEGFCRCVIPEYPGYCCLDCNATAAKIRTITNELRSKNG